MDNLANEQETFFSDLEQKLIDKTRVPSHIAIIPDGNRRWAKNHLLPAEKGHVAGADSVVRIVRAAKELGVKVLSLYSFSTENWKRPAKEIECLMQIIQEYLLSYQQMLLQHNIRLSVIGRLDPLPAGLKKVIDDTQAITKGCTGFDLVLAINYGGRDEIVRAIIRMMSKKISPDDISEEVISQHLDTHSWPDPDLVIRTSGEKRLSNFLLWQSSYSEVYVDNIAWPDFTPKHLLHAICDYQTRERRLGGRTANSPPLKAANALW